MGRLEKTLFTTLMCGLLLNTAFAEEGIKNKYSQANHTLYVSAQGNDKTGDGTSAKPYYSLSKALSGEEPRRITTDTLYVSVAAGDYFMAEPLVVKESFARPVVIRGQKDEKPKFFGGIQVSNWEKLANGLYRAYVPEVARYGVNFEQFYVDNKRATLARTPNDKWYFVKSSKEQSFVKGERIATYAVQRLNFQDADWNTIRTAAAKDLKNMKFRFYHKWDITRKEAAYVDKDSAYIYLQGRGMKPWNAITKGSRYFMYDYLGALDSPGEWYMDREKSYLYYMPLPGENMETAFCMIPVLQEWVSFKGSPGQPVKDITIDGISFQYSSYVIPKEGEEPIQAAALSEAAMRFDYVKNIVLKNCEMLHTGGYAVWFGRECHDNTISRCYLADLGAGGIKIGEPSMRASMDNVTSGNVIDNNIITSAGHEQPCGVGVALFHTSDNTVTHNEIFDILYSGVSVGWVWGYNQDTLQDFSVMNEDNEFVTVKMKLKSPSVRNTVMYNHIHHIGWGELSDMGAVYTLGESPGTRISHNIIHDVFTYDYGGWGLYTDEGSTGVEMSYNLVYGCKSGAFHQHFGKDNRIFNNILAFSKTSHLQCTRAEKHTSFSFHNNIVLTYDEPLFRHHWNTAIIKADNNLYWSVAGKLDFYGKTFADWKKEKEPHSVQMDPGFTNAMEGDFSFRNKKAIKKIGFKEVDFSKVGVYGDAAWKEKAQISSERKALFSKIVEQGRKTDNNS